MMAKRGPTPKENPQRRNDGPARTIGGKVVAPELPGAAYYSERTLVWYATWCSAPQASQFGPTDWQRLHMLAPLVEAYFANPTKDLMAEIRQNESKLGATAEDRQRLRWKFEAPPDEGDEDEKPSPSRGRRDPRAKT